MELKNYMEDLVLEKLDDVMAQYPFCCTCDQCKRDIATLALNHLQPRYISSHKGDVYTRLNEMSVQYEVEVIQAIAKAIEIVHKNPRHEKAD
ncbi:late competence development ComFB family protein [Selenomonas ruminis]|uniref:Competence protein ComFB n=1 Tax=Selenomonas ruminis TaxID=2593411 RepID=A0A5D6W6G9_9FIRM|nr:late competence development ComFB family protein [Selenomonas sp. mPRGC5]TYZ22589.1 competence protein ComFB [Selenomonas sp. mPRGC5]